MNEMKLSFYDRMSEKIFANILQKIQNRKPQRPRAFYLVRPHGTHEPLPPRLGRTPSSRARKTKNFLDLRKNGGGKLFMATRHSRGSLIASD